MGSVSSAQRAQRILGVRVRFMGRWWEVSWAAVKELKLSYYIGETLLFSIYHRRRVECPKTALRRCAVALCRVGGDSSVWPAPLRRCAAPGLCRSSSARARRCAVAPLRRAWCTTLP